MKENKEKINLLYKDRDELLEPPYDPRAVSGRGDSDSKFVVEMTDRGPYNSK